LAWNAFHRNLLDNAFHEIEPIAGAIFSFESSSEPVWCVKGFNRQAQQVANGVDGNAVRTEVIGVQAAEPVIEPVLRIHMLCTHRLHRWTC